MDYFHEKQLFHRDLKPSNILMDDDKHVFIADMGMGKKFNIPFREYTR